MIIKNNGIKYYSSPLASSTKLTSGDNVRHAFFTRIGGVSLAPFNELNVDPLGGDDTIAVSSNIQKISKVIGFEPSRLVSLIQVHGKHVYKVESGGMSERNMEADAVITNAKDIALSIKTADCVPILLIDPVTNSIGAVHAGWKSTVQNIIAETVTSMTESYGTKAENIIAIIGPHIKLCCFEVGDNVKDEFSKAFNGNTNDIIKDNSINMEKANSIQLINSGVLEGNITTEGGCTSCNGEEFFSHRRDGATTGTGRQASIIMIKGA